MAWKIEVTRTAEKQIAKLDKPVQRRILRFLNERIAPAKDPRQLGKALVGEKAQLWRYRVGDYRLICDIQGKLVLVIVLDVGHRKEIYR